MGQYDNVNAKSLANDIMGDFNVQQDQEVNDLKERMLIADEIAVTEDQATIGPVLKESGKSTARSILQTVKGILGSYEISPKERQDLEKIGVNYWKEKDYEPTAGKELVETAITSEFLKANHEVLKDMSFTDQVVMAAPNMGIAAAISIATRKPKLGALFMGTQIMGNQIENLTNEGVPLREATKAGFINAALQYPLESFGLGISTKLWRMKTAVAKRAISLVQATGSEGLTEALQVLPERITDILAKDVDESTLKAIWDTLGDLETYKQMGLEGSIGAIFGFAIGGGGLVKSMTLDEASKTIKETDLTDSPAQTPHEEKRIEDKKEKPEPTPLEAALKKGKAQGKKAVRKVKAKEKKSDVKPKPKVEERTIPKTDIKEQPKVAAKVTKPTETKKTQKEKAPDKKVTKSEEQAIQEAKDQAAEWVKSETARITGKTIEEKPVKKVEKPVADKSATDKLIKEYGGQTPVKKVPKVPTWPKLRTIGAKVDGKIVDPIKIPGVAGKGRHTQKDRDAISRTVADLKKKHGKDVEVGFVVGKQFHKMEDVVAQKIGILEELEAPEGAGGKYRGAQGAAETVAAERKSAKQATKYQTRIKDVKKLTKKQEAEHKALMQSVVGTARRMSKGSKSDFDELKQVGAEALLDWVRLTPAQRKKQLTNSETGKVYKWKPSFVLRNALKDLSSRSGIGSRGSKKIEVSVVPEAKLSDSGILAAAAEDIEDIRTEQDRIVERGKNLGITIDVSDQEKTQKTLEAFSKKLTTAKGTELEGTEKLLKLVKGTLIPRGTVDTSKMGAAKKKAVIKEYEAKIAAEKARDLKASKEKYQETKPTVAKFATPEKGERLTPKERAALKRKVAAKRKKQRIAEKHVGKVVREIPLSKIVTKKTPLEEGVGRKPKEPKIPKPEITGNVITPPRTRDIDLMEAQKPILPKGLLPATKPKSKKRVTIDKAMAKNAIELARRRAADKKDVQRQVVLEAIAELKKKGFSKEQTREILIDYKLIETPAITSKPVAKQDATKAQKRKKRAEQAREKEFKSIFDTMPNPLQNEKGELSIEGIADIGNRINEVVTTSKRIVQAAKPLIDVETVWKRMDAGEVGLAVKTLASVRKVYEDVAAEVAKKIVRTVRQAYPNARGDTFKELLTDVVLGAEKHITFKSWDTEKQFALQPAVSALRNYFDSALAEYESHGITDINFYENTIRRFRSKMSKMKDINQMNNMVRELDRLEQFEFVHLPKELWFPKNSQKTLRTKAQRERAKRRAGFDVLVSKLKRRAISIHDLLEKKIEIDGEKQNIIQKKDVDPITMLLNYGQHVGKDMALIKMRDAAIKEGFVKDQKTRPHSLVTIKKEIVKLNEKIVDATTPAAHKKLEKAIAKKELQLKSLTKLYKTTDTVSWEKLPSQQFSVFKDMWLDTRLIDALNNALSIDDKQNMYQKAVSITKMMQFYNPLFMPMYDLHQALVMGGQALRPVKWSKSMIKAWKDVTTFNDDHQTAGMLGTFSQPFSNPMGKIDDQAKMITRARFDSAATDAVYSTAEALAESVLNIKPVEFIKIMYNASWNTAWKLDAVIRQSTYNYLRESGFREVDAAQAAARLHADYASIPAKTRKALNNVIFTPTFAISMMKVQGAMVQAALRTGMGFTPTSRTDQRLAWGAMTTAATLIGLNALMRSWGYEPEKWGKTWVKTVETPSGSKEQKINFVSPINKSLKYVHWINDYLIQPAIGGASARISIIKDFSRSLSYEGTPLLRAISGLINNKKPNGDSIWFNMDSGPTAMSKGSLYMAQEIIGVFGARAGSDSFATLDPESREALHRELNTFLSINNAMGINFMASARSGKDKRFAAQMRQLNTGLRTDLNKIFRRDLPVDYEELVENYMDRINKMMEQYENE